MLRRHPQSQILMHKDASLFTRFAQANARWTAKPVAFIISLLLILVWAVSGYFYEFSDTWQLVMNTGTTIITFLMVFLIQNTQYRDTYAIHIKLDELIRVTRGAHNSLLELEELTQEELENISKKYKQLAEDARKSLRSGIDDTEAKEILLSDNNS